jgi:hypothetical protein
MTFQNIKPENISIIFTGYNVLPYLQIAIYSFLEQYPQYHQSIVVFDDQSNDGTKEWVEKENFQYITWTNPNNYLIDFKNLQHLHNCIQTGLNASYRNSIMINDIFNQIHTSYVMLNDADVIFLPSSSPLSYNWLETYDILLNDYVVIAPIDEYYYHWDYHNKVFAETYTKNKLGKYIKLYHYDQSLDKEWMERFQFFHGIINLKYLKDQESFIFDDTTDKKFIELIYSNATLDTGSDFTYQLLTNDIPIYEINKKWYYNELPLDISSYTPFLKHKYDSIYIYHARWLSSIQRATTSTDISTCLNNQNVIDKISKDFKTNRRLYDYVMYIHQKYKTEYPLLYSIE